MISLDDDALGDVGFPRVRCAVGGVVVEQAPQSLEGGEPPDLLAPGRHRVVGEVERRHRVQVARDLSDVSIASFRLLVLNAHVASSSYETEPIKRKSTIVVEPSPSRQVWR